MTRKITFGDVDYVGLEKHWPVERRRVWCNAVKCGKVEAIEAETLRALTDQIEHLDAPIRVVIQHPFRVITRQCRHLKSCCFGSAKIGAKVLRLFALSHPWMAHKRL